MKFLIDAQLPKKLSLFLIENGFDSLHTLDLIDANLTTDEQINQLSIFELRIVITKDTDFYNSFLLRKVPYKLLTYIYDDNKL